MDLILKSKRFAADGVVSIDNLRRESGDLINQGDIYWLDLEEPIGSEPGYRHPHVVIQNDLFNHSRIDTVVVCLITSNLKRAKSPGNVLLQKNEGNLPKRSVVNVSQIYTVDKMELFDKIGTLSPKRPPRGGEAHCATREASRWHSIAYGTTLILRLPRIKRGFRETSFAEKRGVTQ